MSKRRKDSGATEVPAGSGMEGDSRDKDTTPPFPASDYPFLEKATREVVFQPMGRRMKFEQDKTILELARKAGVALEATCGGKGLCGKCRVLAFVPGSSPPSDQELELLGPHCRDGERLACQTGLPRGGTV